MATGRQGCRPGQAGSKVTLPSLRSRPKQPPKSFEQRKLPERSFILIRVFGDACRPPHNLASRIRRSGESAVRRPFFAASVVQQCQQNEDRDGNANQPEQDVTHDVHSPLRVQLAICTSRSRRPRNVRSHTPSRSCPPSMAARLAEKAPMSREAVSQKAR
jgi:hypothetical protein